MGRNKRLWLPAYFYHIVCRGNRRDALFHDENDFRVFLYILQQISTKNPFELASYCLMTNHFHLLLRSQEQPISNVMALINKRYANYFNTKNNFTGHVFEQRYFDKIVSSEYSMLKVSRYIHLNPLEAGMVNKPEEYPWSSYRLLIGSASNNKLPLNLNAIFEIFSGTDLEKRNKYREYVEEEGIVLG